MSLLSGAHRQLVRFAGDQSGAVATITAISVPMMLGLAGLAEFSVVHSIRNQLQATADAAALAAAQTEGTNPQRKAEAARIGGVNMDPDLHGVVVRESDVRFRHWDPAAREVTGGSPKDAVVVTAKRARDNGNPLSLTFLRFFGIASTDIEATAVAVILSEGSCTDLEGFPAGTVITDQIPGMTLDVSGGAGLGMVFDTTNPTGGDTDLFSETRGMVLIISEDGDSGDPDDNAGGGTLTFTFDDAQNVASLVALDTEEGGTMTARDENGAILAQASIPRLPDGTEAIVSMDVSGVYEITIQLRGSGAFDDFCFGLSERTVRLVG